jgi:hypothetical protein
MESSAIRGQNPLGINFGRYESESDIHCLAWWEENGVGLHVMKEDGLKNVETFSSTTLCLCDIWSMATCDRVLPASLKRLLS